MKYRHAPLPGYEDLYEISTSGKIRNLRWPMSSPLAFVTRRVHTNKNSKTSYWRLVLSKDEIVRWHYLHTLIGKAFVPGYKPGLVINHKDGNGLNCHPDNLEWVTQKENIHHSIHILKRNAGPKPGHTGKSIKITKGGKIHIFPSYTAAELHFKFRKLAISQTLKTGSNKYKGYLLEKI